FCCNREKRILLLLPPYPTEMNKIIDNRNASTLSQKLNALFLFTAIGVQRQFINLLVPSSVCITGSQECKVPNEWVSIIQQILSNVNPYACSLKTLWNNPFNTLLELSENTSSGKVAAIIHANNIINIQPRSILIWHNTNSAPEFVNILSAQYEPLQYPLFFSHGTPKWYPNNSYNFSQIE
ncbi:15421_t:CDS:2, partial [Gigaspora margarita]